MVRRVFIENLRHSWGGYDRGLKDVLKEAVNSIIVDVEKKWRSRQGRNRASKLKVSVVVPLSGLDQWNDIRGRLRDSDFIQKLDIRQISLNEALLDIYFQTSFDRLVEKLKGQGYL